MRQYKINSSPSPPPPLHKRPKRPTQKHPPAATPQFPQPLLRPQLIAPDFHLHCNPSPGPDLPPDHIRHAFHIIRHLPPGFCHRRLHRFFHLLFRNLRGLPQHQFGQAHHRIGTPKRGYFFSKRFTKDLKGTLDEINEIRSIRKSLEIQMTGQKKRNP